MTVRVRRTERCACGGTIRPQTLSAKSIRRAVELHQETGLHLAWQERDGLELAVEALRRETRHRCPCTGEDA